MAENEIKVKSLKKALDVLNCFLVKQTYIKVMYMTFLQHLR